jgi:transcriptional regulator with XRE-family HTH domain
MYDMLMSPFDMLKHISKAAKEKRLSQNLSQQSLSDRSGVSLGVLKKFEITGKISIESLLKIAMALGCLGDFLVLFKKAPPESFASIDQLLKQKTRKRGRK